MVNDTNQVSIHISETDLRSVKEILNVTNEELSRLPIKVILQQLRNYYNTI